MGVVGFVGQDGILRPIGNRPLGALPSSQAGRFPIGRRIPSCPTGFLLFLFALTAAAQNWPSFRGPSASGVADRQKLPMSWDAAQGTHIRWKTRIPGLAHSSPIVWADQVFVTTAVSSRADAS